MKVEENWNDCVIYLVGFWVKDKNKENIEPRIVHKTVVLDSEEFDIPNNQKKIEKEIFEKFRNVIKIDYIDVWSEDALRPKLKKQIIFQKGERIDEQK